MPGFLLLDRLVAHSTIPQFACGGGLNKCNSWDYGDNKSWVDIYPVPQRQMSCPVSLGRVRCPEGAQHWRGDGTGCLGLYMHTVCSLARATECIQEHEVRAKNTRVSQGSCVTPHRALAGNSFLWELCCWQQQERTTCSHLQPAPEHRPNPLLRQSLTWLSSLPDTSFPGCGYTISGW